jgi:hypothetical protein
MTYSPDVIAFSVRSCRYEITPRHVNLFSGRLLRIEREDKGVYEEWLRGA